MAETAAISVVELKRLLIDLIEKRPDICIRFRLIGQMWMLHFTRVILVTEKGVIVNDEASSKMISVPNLMHVMQFEIDRRFQNFRPHFHYDVNGD